MASDLIRTTAELSARLEGMAFSSPVAFVYNPLEYAWEAHRAYLERYGGGSGRTLLLGMNPGPWGMAQTGIPFGDPVSAREFLGIDRPVGRPQREHPKKRVEGFGQRRREISGKRLWGWAEETFGSAPRFFESFFVLNYCPLCFLSEGGANLTPDKLPARETEPLFEACDRALRRAVKALSPGYLVGIGQFAEKRLQTVFGTGEFRIGRILHPSPANPQAATDWGKKATEALRGMGIGF